MASDESKDPPKQERRTDRILSPENSGDPSTHPALKCLSAGLAQDDRGFDPPASALSLARKVTAFESRDSPTEVLGPRRSAPAHLAGSPAMTCPSCGREGPPRDGRCTHCGASWDDAALARDRTGTASHPEDDDATVVPSAGETEFDETVPPGQPSDEMEFDETVPPGQPSVPPTEPGGQRATATQAPDVDSGHTLTVDEARIAAEERDVTDDDMDAGETRLDSQSDDDIEDDRTIGVAEVLSGAGQPSEPPQDLESDGTVVLQEDQEGHTAPPRAPARREAPRQGGPLRVGESFGDRYRIDVLLGIGGMGAVYKAWDRELDIPVALKVIRPEIAGDERASADIARRFKRELLLARKGTHM